MVVTEAGTQIVDKFPDTVDRGLMLYTIYWNPSDYPGQHVVRRMLVGSGQLFIEREAWVVAPRLETARDSIPEGYARHPRDPQDDPCIVEVWL